MALRSSDFVSQCNKVSTAATDFSKLMRDFADNQLVVMEEHTNMFGHIHTAIITLESALTMGYGGMTASVTIALKTLKAAVDEKKPAFSKWEYPKVCVCVCRREPSCSSISAPLCRLLGHS